MEKIIENQDLSIPEEYRTLIFSQEEKEYCWIVTTIDGIHNLPKVNNNQFINSRKLLFNYLKEKHKMI